MTTFKIKIFAILFMVVDHVGLFFFPQYILFRVFGRIAFPLFAWMIANGAKHTGDIRIYGLRLLALAVVSQIPFWLVNLRAGAPLFYLNVVFTLVLGLLAIYCVRSSKNKGVQILSVVACAALADMIHSDYGAAGVFCIAAFYVFYDNFPGMAAAQVLLMGLLPLGVFYLEVTMHTNLEFFYIDSYIEWCGLLSLAFIAFYNGKLGTKAKSLFYYFYPLQYVGLFIGQMLFR